MGEKAGRAPKYMEIYEHYKRLIQTGEAAEKDRLPSESEIGKQFSVSRITVVKALDLLSNQGLIYRIQGGGTFVSPLQQVEQKADPVNLISLITAFQPMGRENSLIRSIERQVSNAGYLLSVSNSNDDPETERKLILSIKDRVKGIILYTSRSNSNADLFYDLFCQRYPIVYVDKHPFNVPCNSVVSDNFDGGYQIGKHLLAHGHKRFALIFHKLTEFSSELGRYNGFMQAMQEAGVKGDNIRLFNVDAKAQQLPQVLDEIAGDQQADGGITAIFACNDMLANRLMNDYGLNGISSTPKVAFAGFDDIITPTGEVPFITVRQNLSQIGKQASRMLISQIQRPSIYTDTQVVPIQLVAFGNWE